MLGCIGRKVNNFGADPLAPRLQRTSELACQPNLQRSEGWWAREELNLHLLRDTVLSRTRIPVPPRAHILDYFSLSEMQFPS